MAKIKKRHTLWSFDKDIEKGYCKSHMLLVGMQISIATLESSLEVWAKGTYVHNLCMIQYSTLRYMSNENAYVFTKRQVKIYK